jgi:[ribosomal protein S5]-alanine N-acetyltransferase
LEIKLQKCTIREWRAGDIEALTRNANNYNVWRNVRDRFPHPYTTAAAERWIGGGVSAPPFTQFAIEAEGEAAGGIGIMLKDDVYRRMAEIGYWLGEPYWGRGIGTEAVIAVTEYAFANFDLCRIAAYVFEWNPGSARVLEKAGYQLEGRLRESATKEGQTIDELVYAKVIA